MLLDSQHRLIDYLEPFRGTLNQASVYPREIVKMALSRNDLSVFLVRNPPSRLAEASAADISFTKHLKQVLALVDVRLLDNFIVAGPEVLSMVEGGAFLRKYWQACGLAFFFVRTHWCRGCEEIVESPFSNFSVWRCMYRG